MLSFTAVSATSGCDLTRFTVDTTSKVLARAQPAMEQEADYELAAQALPGTLKTVEGFYYADQGNRRLIGLLAQGYCQYGIGFVEDEWEEAEAARRFDDAEHLSNRATKIFVRCMNYGLRLLGKRWQERIFAEYETVRRMVAAAGKDQRDGLMWAAIGLASTINHNRDDITIVAQLPTAKMMLERVVELDDRHDMPDMMKRALPHLALGLLYAATAKAMGGDPDQGRAHFERALALTGNKFLLAKTLLARHYAVITQNRELYRKTLLEVLRTPPSIWPEQRLANEIAHRRARRYLKLEKELF